MRKTKLRIVLGIFLLVSSSFVSAENAKQAGDWVSAWSTAVHTPLPFPGLPPTPVFQNQTIRMVVRPTIGGERVRIRLSNAYGTSPLEVGAAHIALTDHGSLIAAGSDHVLTFNGKTSISIPIGAPALSDPVEMKVTPTTEVSVSVYLPRSTPANTTHFWAQHETYITGPGDLTAKPQLAKTVETKSWYFLSDVEVWSGDRAGAVITLGDSITDGVGAAQGTYGDWPNLLANRLVKDSAGPHLAVLNEGIGGNRILHDGAGINALARLDTDVLSQPGVTEMILLEGINDIGWPHMKLPPSKGGGPERPSPFSAEGVTVDDVTAGMRQIIDRAHEHGIRVFGATLTPYAGADYFTADGEQVRQAVNQWIRTSGAFDGVIDFDVAVRDPDHPEQFLDRYQSGDHLHPNAAGYKAMADSIDLKLLRSSDH